MEQKYQEHRNRKIEIYTLPKKKYTKVLLKKVKRIEQKKSKICIVIKVNSYNSENVYTDVFISNTYSI